MRSKKPLIAGTAVTNGDTVLYTDGYGVTKTVEQFATYDTIAINAANPAGTVTLTMANTGKIDLTNALDGKRAALVTASAEGNEIITGDKDDTLYGAAGTDTLRGGAGRDTIFGHGGNDVLDGGDGDDLLNGNAGDDTIVGGAGDDTIYDDSGRLDIDAGAGNDIIGIGDGRVGVIDGGADRDTLYAPGNLTGLDIRNVEVLATSGFGITATVAQLDAFDVIVTNEANPQSSVTIVVADGGRIDLSDELDGKRAATVTASAEGNEIVTGDKDDTLFGAAGTDTLRGGAGRDTIFGQGGNDVLDGGDGDDLLNGNAGDDTILGGAGDDTIYDDSGRLDIDAGAGNDIIGIGDGRVGVIDGGADRDTLYAPGNLTGLDIRNVEVLATSGFGITATVAQLDAFDVILTNEANPQSDVTLTLADGGKLDLSDELAGQRAVTVQASALGNDITAGDKNDSLYGGIGNDVLRGGAGRDLIRGGGGNDTLDGGDGNDSLNGSAGDDIVLGGAGDDTITDDSGRLDIDGGAGADTIAVGDHRVGRVDGGADSDILYAYGDITGMTISNVETLGTSGYGITGAVAQFEAFDTIAVSDTNRTSDVVLTLADGGTLDLSDELEGKRGAVVTTSALGNEVIGGDKNDVFYGRDANDILRGGLGNDTLHGNKGDDTLDGGAGDDTLLGGEGNDVFITGLGNDTIFGGTGTNRASFGGAFATYTLGYSQGQDTVSSGTGTTRMADIHYLDFVDGTYDVRTATFTPKVTGVTINGTAGNDVITPAKALPGQPLPTGNADTLYGFAGHDRLDGGAGADAMYGGTGNDTYHVDDAGDRAIELDGEGTDTIFASVDYQLAANVEHLVLTGAATSGVGNAGANSLKGNALANTLSGMAGNDVLYGYDGRDLLLGGEGNDILDGGTGVDRMEGGIGNDIYYVDDAADEVVERAGEGTDTVLSSVSYTLSGEVENLTLIGAAIAATGNASANRLLGNALANRLEGGQGHDTLDGGAGADVMDGGTGNDTFFVNEAGDRVIEREGEGNDTVVSAIDYALGDHVENLTLAGSAVVGAGNALSNRLTGNALSNRLIGGEGDDTLDGGAGADRLEGGVGNDTYVVHEAGDEVVELADAGNDTVRSYLSDYALADNLENLTLLGGAVIGHGNAAANKLIGNGEDNILSGYDGDDSLFGNAGSDELIGGEGNDLLDGGLGADVMDGGKGHDTYIVDQSGDVVFELEDGGIDTVKSYLGYTLGSNLENLVLMGGALRGDGNEGDNKLIGNEHRNVLIGNGGNDSLLGNAGDDLMFGGEGNDILNGGTGADTMYGGTGNDTYYVDDAGDQLREEAGEGIDTITTTVTRSIADNIENLTMAGTADIRASGNDVANVMRGNAGANTLQGYGGNDSLYGGDGKDLLIGGDGDDLLSGDAGDDYLLGGEGVDTLIGGAGADTMEGGAGNDSFLFTSASDANGDQVLDFATGDRLNLSRIDAVAGTAANEAFTFLGTAGFSGKAGQLRYEVAGDRTTIMGDVNGDAVADFAITLTGTHTLLGGDFFL
ncbi:beta strand repeat-containing protein [Sphingomonas adhaesiva]|uniref:beta strand repeat-containing protein n=1 Tax=Sphingomonas adhaesiva TaxID=28212 RepID=UPI002FF47525